MKITEVSKQDFETAYPDLDAVSKKLDKLKRNPVGHVNWPEFSYRPQVEFSAGYTENEILIRYYVTEEYFKAEMTGTNQEVYEDSCVEFFVSPADDGIYYNFEFNGIGTCLMGSGTSRETSRRADPALISTIRRRSSAGDEPVSERKGRFSWNLAIAIPFTVFMHHEIDSPGGKTFRANFYKCGDKLTAPHYLTWNPVETVKPDFHRPEFFGMIRFI